MAAGAVGDVHATAVGIAKSFGMLPRDLRLLATRSANLAVRPLYFIFRLPPFTGVVSSDQAVLIADNGGADARMQALLAAGLHGERRMSAVTFLLFCNIRE